jgi:hypothetical protein
MSRILSDRTRRNAIADLRDIADRRDNFNICDSDRARDSRTLRWIADDLENQRSGDLKNEQLDLLDEVNQ